MTEERLSFKEMCARFDVTPRTLRYYEYIELLSPDREGRSRFYGPTEIARMTLILRGRHFGFPLEDIRKWLLMYDEEGSEQQLREFIVRADQQIAELEAEKDRLQKTIGELRDLRDSTAEQLEGANDTPKKRHGS